MPALFPAFSRANGFNRVFLQVLITGINSGVARNFKRGGGTQFLFFFGKTNSKMIEKQEKFSGGPVACSPKNFLKTYML